MARVVPLDNSTDCTLGPGVLAMLRYTPPLTDLVRMALARDWNHLLDTLPSLSDTYRDAVFWLQNTRARVNVFKAISAVYVAHQSVNWLID